MSCFYSRSEELRLSTDTVSLSTNKPDASVESICENLGQEGCDRHGNTALRVLM